MILLPNESVFLDFQTYSFTTGNLTNADLLPTVIAKKNGVLDASFPWLVWNSGTGTYGCSGAVPSSYVVNDCVNVIASAVVSAVSGSVTIATAIIDTKRASTLSTQVSGFTGSDGKVLLSGNTQVDLSLGDVSLSGALVTGGDLVIGGEVNIADQVAIGDQLYIGDQIFVGAGVEITDDLIVGGSFPAVTLTTAAATGLCATLLKMDWSQVTGEAARSVLNSLRYLRNKIVISGTTLTVTKEDDSTPAWAATLTTDTNAEPITGIDPT